MKQEQATMYSRTQKYGLWQMFGKDAFSPSPQSAKLGGTP